MCLLGWSADIADADNFFNILLSMDLEKGERTVQNVAFYENPELQEMLNGVNALELRSGDEVRIEIGGEEGPVLRFETDEGEISVSEPAASKAWEGK